MGFFDYMFDPRLMPQAGPRGLLDGLFANRWAPVSEALQSGAFDPQGMNNTDYDRAFSYTPPQPPPQSPIPAPINPGYYGGAPETNPLLAPRDPQNAPARRPPAPQLTPEQAPGIGDRFGAGLQGAGASFMSGGGPIGAIVNLLGGLATGKRTDPQGVANEEVLRMYRFLQTKEGGGLSPAQAQSVVMHPEMAKEYYKGLVNGQPVILPDGSVAMPGTFGAAPRIVGAAPKPEIKDFYDPTTGRMVPGAITPPSAANPNMRITMPGLPGQGSAPQLPGQNTGVTFTAPSAAEKKTQEGIAEANVADLKTINTQALAANNQRTIFQRMRQLNEMPNLGEGGLASIQQSFRSAMVSLGLGDASRVKPGEEFQSLSNGLILEASGGTLGAQISNSDREFMAARIPQLTNTKEGRAEMLQTLELLAQRKIEIAKEAQKYRMSHGGSLDGFQTYIADWANKPENQLFKNRPAMTNPTEGGPIRIPDGMTPEQVRKTYKSGQQIILPDGRLGVVP